MSIKWKNKVKWYLYLNNPDKRNLFADLNSENQFIVCQEFIDLRMYAAFNNYIDFVHYLLNEEIACMHEVCPEWSNVKMFFDIDVPNNDSFNKKNFFDHLITEIIKIYKREYSATLSLSRDIIILDSSSDEKQSYHIIIDNWYHRNIKDANYMAQLIRKELPEDIKKYIDFQVYTNNHTLRTLMSIKKGRTFKFVESWNFQDKKIDHEYPDLKGVKIMMQFESSCITVTKHCNMLPFKREDVIYKECNLIDSDVQELLLKLSIFLRCQLDEIPFKVGKIINGIICLNRIKKSNCKICNRIHESENAYIQKSDMGFWFNCRRSESGGRFLSEDLEKKGEDLHEDVVVLNNFVKKSPDIRDINGLKYSIREKYEIDTRDDILKLNDSLGIPRKIP